jgi:hypothetical protein
MYTQNQAVLIRLLQSNGEFVPLPELMAFTRKHCKSESYVVHSRINDLRKNHGYTIDNDTSDISAYRIRLTPTEIKVLRNLWKERAWKGIPHYSEVRNRMKPVQTSMNQMFAGVTV